MLPDEMEAEKNRKLLLAQADTIEILEKNVHDLQQQLRDSYIVIAHKQKKLNVMEENECFCGLVDEPVLAGRD